MWWQQGDGETDFDLEIQLGRKKQKTKNPPQNNPKDTDEQHASGWLVDDMGLERHILRN